jgi:hypothetical protein
MVQPNTVGHVRGIFETPEYPNDYLVVAEPMLPPDDPARGRYYAGVGVPQHVADWSVPIHNRLLFKNHYHGGQHLAERMADEPGWSVAYAANQPEVPLAFSRVHPRWQRLPFVGVYAFNEFNVVPDGELTRRYAQAAAALMYCALKDEPSRRNVFLCSAAGDKRSGQLFSSWGFEVSTGWAIEGGMAGARSDQVVAKIERRHPFVSNNLHRPRHIQKDS